ncbi:hypothetical protein [Candidatus Lokiarchaeum ossiferum]|uniref:hypothetical protein n=1 Tax=Candidatus Lokiarchaeum ossiferum TaxID=2951803 RepID=UPI00352E4FA4
MAFSQMNEDEQELYLDVLRDGTTPFDRFVARGKMEDTVDIPGPRINIDRYLFRSIRQTQSDSSARMLPILGSAGTGKTHAYWAYKSIERRLTQEDQEDANVAGNYPEQWTIVYVPSPPAAVRILLHVYTCLLDELTADILTVVSDNLVTRWGGHKKKKLGIFGGQDLEETIQNGIREYPGIFADCVKSLCIFALDKERQGLAERWLLGEDLDEDELDVLGINTVIESDDVCLAMIKLICENAGRSIVLYFDELESPYRMHGPEAEQKFLETLKQVYNNVKNVVIVLAVLKEIWPRVLETADQAMKSRMEQERELEFFKFDDLKLYFAKAMEYFWAKNNLNPPIYPLFPLNEQVLKVIFDKTDGNQRSIIKLIRLFVDKIVYDEMTLEEVIQSGKSDAVPVGTTTAIPDAVPAAAPSTKEEKSIIDKIEEMMKDEDYTIEANPASVAGAALKSIKVLAEKFNKKINIDMDFKFQVGKRSYSLAGVIEFEGKKYGLEIPAVKSFDKSGGVAAFYAAKRLTQAISTNSVDVALLIVPEGTGGAKYTSLLSQNEGKMFKYEFNEESAKFLIQQAIKQPSKEGKIIAEQILGEMADYEPPMAPWEMPAPEAEEGNPEDAPSEPSPDQPSAE